MNQRTRTNIIIAIIFVTALFVGVVIYSIYTSISRSGKVPVEIVVVPSDATVTIGGAITSPGTAYLQPGTYKVEVHKEGFEPFSQDQPVDETRTGIFVGLTPESDDAQKWASAHQKDYQNLEAAAGKASDQDGATFQDINPIVSVLPYENLLYSVGYSADPADPTGNSIILEIDAPEGYRQAAIYQIYQLGFDPTDYKINFSNYTNPFTAS